MRGFFDASCPKCRKRIGWAGSLEDKPPCPKCGHTDDPAVLAEEARELDEMREKMAKKIAERDAKDWAERTPELEACYRQGWEDCGAADDPHDSLARLRANPYSPRKTGIDYRIPDPRCRFWNWGWNDREFDVACRLEEEA